MAETQWETCSADALLREFFAQDDLSRLAEGAGALLGCPLLVLDDTFHVAAHHLPLGFSDAVFQTSVRSGEITYDGNLISKMEAHKIVRLGLAQVPEGRRVFSGLTVQQNLSMGAYTRHDGKDAIQSDYDMVFDLLPRLKERRNQPAGTLSGGEQQMLAVGRALMCKPKILLLDEPSLGLAPLIIQDIFKTLQAIRSEGTTILMVEQNALATLKIADYGYVLELGKISMHGPASQLVRDERLIEAYLGNKK